MYFYLIFATFFSQIVGALFELLTRFQNGHRAFEKQVI